MSQRGDQYVRVILHTPPKLTDRQKELFRELSEIEGKQIQEDKRSLFEKIKDGLGDVKKGWLG